MWATLIEPEGCMYICTFVRYVCITKIITAEEVMRRRGGNDLIIVYSHTKLSNNLKMPLVL